MSESYSNVTNKGVPFDLKLNKEIFFEKENGFFIELGAYDGLTQSNTAFFEKTKNWTGILIEASRDRYEECVKNRPNSKCVNTACSATDNASISFNHENGLMSKVVDDGVYSCDTSTLETILDNCEVDRNIDFLSLDVEGHELEVLEGLNLLLSIKILTFLFKILKTFDAISFIEISKLLPIFIISPMHFLLNNAFS